MHPFVLIIRDLVFFRSLKLNERLCEVPLADHLNAEEIASAGVVWRVLGDRFEHRFRTTGLAAPIKRLRERVADELRGRDLPGHDEGVVERIERLVVSEDRVGL